MSYQTSKQAYEDLVKTKKLDEFQAKVLKAILEKLFPLTVEQITILTDLTLGFSARAVEELKEKGLVQNGDKLGNSSTWKVSYDIAL